MTYTITREDRAKDAAVIRDALDVLREIGGGINEEATEQLQDLAASIEAASANALRFCTLRFTCGMADGHDGECRP